MEDRIEHSLRIERTGGVCRLTLARPKLRNALDPTLIEALTTAFTELADDTGIRVIVLSGEGEHFCAGADLQWMHATAALSAEENHADAMRLGALFATIDRSSKPVVARVQGAAIGGGAGLAAVCDVVIAEERAVFAFAEVRLGLIPAVIAPFVVAKIGFSQARALFMSGERINAARAARIGLVHETATVEKPCLASVDAKPRVLFRALFWDGYGREIRRSSFDRTGTVEWNRDNLGDPLRSERCRLGF